MGQPAHKIQSIGRATLAELNAVPANLLAELIGGTLYTMTRPAPKHGVAASRLGGELLGPFDRGRGGPGGWWILDEPELRFPDPAAPGEVDVIVPDLAGWRRERMPKLPKTKYFALAPDWICEVLSPSTAAHDRGLKMPPYAREGVRLAWLVDPIARTLEIFSLGADGRWVLAGVHGEAAVVRAPPFDAIELELSALWAEAEGDEEEA
jgi:Uma2 family endonuclease